MHKAYDSCVKANKEEPNLCYQLEVPILVPYTICPEEPWPPFPVQLFGAVDTCRKRRPMFELITTV